MSKTTLKELKSLVEGDEKVAEKIKTAVEVGKRTKKIDRSGRAYGTGRRKNSVARVWIKAGSGQVTVKKGKSTKRHPSVEKTAEQYFARPSLKLEALSPLSLLNQDRHFDVLIVANGGGLRGQAGAVKLGLARALLNFDPAFHNQLRAAGMLTRDSRIVERKKPGKRKARRSPQFSKR